MLRALWLRLLKSRGPAKQEFAWECTTCGHRLFGKGATVREASEDVHIQQQMHYARTGHFSYQLKGDQQ